MGNIYKEYTPPASSGGKYLKLEDGVTYKLRIMSEPVIFDSEYKDQLSTKYAWVVWNVEEDSVQILQLPVTGFRAVATIGADDDYGDPLENAYNLKVTRTGTGKETKYSIVPAPSKEEPSEEVIAQADQVDLIGDIDAGPGSQRVQWLRDALTGRKEPDKKPEKDVVIEDIDEEPINLDDIPF